MILLLNFRLLGKGRSKLLVTRIENTVFLRKTISLNSPRSHRKKCSLVSTRNRIKEKEKKGGGKREKRKRKDKKISSRAFLTDSPRDADVCSSLLSGTEERGVSRDAIPFFSQKFRFRREQSSREYFSNEQRAQ